LTSLLVVNFGFTLVILSVGIGLIKDFRVGAVRVNGAVA